MSCNTCQSKYTFFTRENACPNCGFSYCSKCLKYKCDLASGQTKKVCGPCYNKLTMSSKGSPAASSSSEMPPPGGTHPIAPLDIIKKMEALENPTQPPIVIYKRRALDNLKLGLEPADQEILERLKRLKDEDKQLPLPSVDEIRRRLAILKDQDPDANHPAIDIHQTDTRTDQQKEEDLIREYSENLHQSAGTDRVNEIRSRLDALKGFDSSKEHSEEQPDSDEEIEALLRRAIEEAWLSDLSTNCETDELESRQEMDVEAREPSSEDEATCCICEQTASELITRLVQCTSCTGDLYCAACFEDTHDQKHKTVPYKRGRTAIPD